MKKNYLIVILLQKYGKFWSVSLGHFIKHKPLIFEELMYVFTNENWMRRKISSPTIRIIWLSFYDKEFKSM